MEKENKEIVENTEQKEYRVKESGQTDKKKVINKKKTYAILGIILLLCLGIFIFLRINMTEKHVYEEVENLAEREGVCFDNLLLTSGITLLNDSGEKENRYLCIFNTGDVYSFEWPAELTTWGFYYSGDKEQGTRAGYDETVWEKMYNVVYLGRLSKWETFRLNRYVQDYDDNGEYYNRGESEMVVPDGNGESWQDRELSEETYIWRHYYVEIFWQGLQRSSGKFVIIESSDMNYISDGIYEKGEIDMKSYEENAVAALELFESSGFYDRWVAMCLSNE